MKENWFKRLIQWLADNVSLTMEPGQTLRIETRRVIIQITKKV